MYKGYISRWGGRGGYPSSIRLELSVTFKDSDVNSGLKTPDVN